MSFKEYKTLDLIKISEHISSFWKVDKTFEKSISTRDDKEFIFYEGPPSRLITWMIEQDPISKININELSLKIKSRFI